MLLSDSHLPQIYDIISSPAIASHGDMTGLRVEREQLQVHGAAQGERDSDTIENITIGVDSHVQVGLNDIVKLSSLLVPEERVRHPDLLTVRHGQVLDLPVQVVKLQPVVVPLLSEGDLDTELHLDIVNLLEAADKQAAQHHGRVHLI